MRKFEEIVIIDDSTVDLIILKKALNLLEISDSIREFKSGIQALDYITKLTLDGHHFPDLMLLDINMPLLTGFEVLDTFDQLLRDKKQHCNVVMMSSVENDMLWRKAFSYHCVIDYILKPISRINLQRLCDDIKIQDVPLETSDAIALNY